MRLIFATHNANKTKEVKKLLPTGIDLLSLTDINYTADIAETAATIEGNALLKVQTIYNAENTACFADDSGLLVDALDGAPGVYSARYAGEQKSDEANIEKLLAELKNTSNRKAHFKTVLALIINGNDYLFEGIINGVIVPAKKGSNGFGYDPVFMPDGYTKTFAEMSMEEKSAISHRGIAVKKLVEFLKNI